MSRKAIGFILIVIGVIALAASLSADLTGLFSTDTTEFGWLQLLGTILGAVVAVVGVFLVVQKKKGK